MEYSDKMMEHFRNPKNVRDIRCGQKGQHPARRRNEIGHCEK